MQLRQSARASRHLRITIATALMAMTPLALGAVAMPQPAIEPPPVMAAQPAASGALDRIRASGKLVLGYRTDARPMSYQDASGQAAGYAVALCQKVADGLKSSLGLSTLAVEWVAVAPDAGIRDVQQGQVDLLCGEHAATLTEREVVSFSIPIFPGGISALLRDDASEQLQRVLEERPPPYQPLWRGTAAQSLQVLERKTFSVVEGTSAVDWVVAGIARLRLTATIAPADTYDAGVGKVVDRDSAVLFGDRARLLDAAKRSAQSKDLKVLTRHFTFAPLALTLSRNDDDFRLVVDRALSGFYANLEFGDIYAASFGPADPDTIQFFRTVAVPK